MLYKELKELYDKCVVKRVSPSFLANDMGTSTDDCVDLVKINDENDLQNVNKYIETTCDSHNSVLLNESAIGTVQIIEWDALGSHWNYIYGTVDDYKANICKKLDELVAEISCMNMQIKPRKSR